MPERLQDVTGRIAAVQRRRDLWPVLLDFYHERGIAMVSFQLLGGEGGSGNRPLIVQDGYPDGWTEEYLDGGYASVDPMAELSRLTGRPLLWSEIESMPPLTPSGIAFLRRRHDTVGTDGITLRVYGPEGQDALVGLGFATGRRSVSAEEMFQFQSVAQLGHLRYLAIAARKPEGTTPLSEREREVLSWIARGKSNADIGNILAVSPHTVDTHVRRLFDKLEVSDRTTAAVKAVGVGLLPYATLGVP